MANESTDEVGHVKAWVTAFGGVECADSMSVVPDSSKQVGTFLGVKTSTYDGACLPAEEWLTDGRTDSSDQPNVVIAVHVLIDMTSSIEDSGDCKAAKLALECLNIPCVQILQVPCPGITAKVHESVVVDFDPYLIDDMCAAADHSFDELAVTANGLEMNSKTIMLLDTLTVEGTVCSSDFEYVKEEVKVCTYVAPVEVPLQTYSCRPLLNAKLADALVDPMPNIPIMHIGNYVVD